MLTVAEVLGLDATEWQAVVALAGMPIVIASLWLLILQTRREGETTKASVHQSITDSMIEVDRLFFDNPQYRKYFYDGVEPPADPDEAVRVEALAELMLDFLDNCIAQQDRLGSGMAMQWRHYVKEMLATSPALRSFLAKHEDWYEDVVKARDERPLLQSPRAPAGVADHS